MSFLSALVALLVVLPGIFVMANNPKEQKNRLFLGLSFFLSLWVLFNTLVDLFDSTALLFTRLTFIVITIGIVIFWDFTHHFPIKTKYIFPRKIAYLVAIGLIALEATNAFIPSIIFEDNIATVVPGLLYPTFVVFYLLFLIMAIFRLILNVRNTRGIERQRTKMVFLAMLLMSTWTSLTNLILPLFMGNNMFAPFGPYATLIFTGLIGYAMFKHHLFDIRAAITRAVTYVATIGMLVGIYLTVLYLVTLLLGGQELSDTVQQIIFIGLTLFSATLYPLLRNNFDRLTSKIFYKDVYDSQEFLDQMSGIISATSNLAELTKNALRTIEYYLKPETVGLGIIKSTEPLEIYVVSTDQKKIGQQELEGLSEVIKNPDIKVLRQEDIENQSIKKRFEKMGIELLVNLSTTDEHVGYLGLAGKKNGESYSDKDFRVMDIIADELAVAFQNSLRYDEIEQFNVTLQEEVHDATKKLQRSNDKLKALDETKDEFISMASHQLRTPLTSVKGYLSMVLEGDAGELNEQQRKLLGQAFTSSQRMVYLIADLLNVSRLRTGKFVIEAKPTNLPELVTGELEQLKEAAVAKNLELTFEPPKDFPTLNLDETKIRQVIMNFSDNAIYYTPAGGKIRVELEAKPDAVEFRVVDNGLGVPRAEQHHLFTKFYRAGNAKRARPDGTGLGLFMAKKVVIAQGGAIIFKSIEGKGSTFGFTFPRKPLEVKEATQP